MIFQVSTICCRCCYSCCFSATMPFLFLFFSLLQLMALRRKYIAPGTYFRFNIKGFFYFQFNYRENSFVTSLILFLCFCGFAFWTSARGSFWLLAGRRRFFHPHPWLAGKVDFWVFYVHLLWMESACVTGTCVAGENCFRPQRKENCNCFFGGALFGSR